LPIDSDDADQENKLADGTTLLYVFERGYKRLGITDMPNSHEDRSSTRTGRGGAKILCRQLGQDAKYQTL
jgi:hypothetical protein